MGNLRLAFGRHLSRIRREKGYSQAELAEKADVTIDFIGLIERGLSAPSFETLERLANALDIPLADFFRFDAQDSTRLHKGEYSSNSSAKEGEILKQGTESCFTPHDQLLGLIANYATNLSMSFDDKSQALIEFIRNLSDNSLSSLLTQVGFIPENYDHDSSEEKVYAKAMDIIVAECLRRVGYDAEVSKERSNSADVTAKCLNGKVHSVVLDAKAFRLSRTALNPKDYKIEALNSWRKEADYASLVAPLAGFPLDNSRLFNEAIKFNVTLLTFSHLQFVLENGLPSYDALVPLWEVSARLQGTIGNQPSATEYWREVDYVFCNSLGAKIEKWKKFRRNYFQAMLDTAEEQIKYLENQKDNIHSLPREFLEKVAIKAMKLNNKIKVVKAKKQKALQLLDAIDKAE